MPEWVRAITANEKTDFVEKVARNREQLLAKKDDQSVDNALLILVNPEFVEEVGKQDPFFLSKYSDDLNAGVDSSVANLIRRMLTPEMSLCDSGQFDIFVCRLEKKTLSVCLGEKDGLRTIQYRVGSKERLQLLLEKPAPIYRSDTTESEKFSNGNHLYTVRFGGRHSGDDWSGVLVQQDNQLIEKQRCQPGEIEPFRWPKK